MRVGTGTGATGLKWLLGDHLGSTSLTADGAAGTKLTELKYRPWGELRYAWGTTPTERRYTGQRAEGIGLYDYGARFYDPYFTRGGTGAIVNFARDPDNPGDINLGTEANRHGAYIIGPTWNSTIYDLSTWIDYLSP